MMPDPTCHYYHYIVFLLNLSSSLHILFFNISNISPKKDEMLQKCLPNLFIRWDFRIQTVMASFPLPFISKIIHDNKFFGAPGDHL